jgi:hypothetical protein
MNMKAIIATLAICLITCFAKAQNKSFDLRCTDIDDEKIISINLGDFEEGTADSVKLNVTNNRHVPFFIDSWTRTVQNGKVNLSYEKTWVSEGGKTPITITIPKNKMTLGKIHDEVELTIQIAGVGSDKATLSLDWNVNPKGKSQPMGLTSSVSPEEKKCIDFIDMCMKECNGGLISKRNFHQLSASFTGTDIWAVRDDGERQGKKEYSSICIAFIDGYGPNVFTELTSNGNSTHGKDVTFNIVVKKERAKACRDMIYRLNELAESKLPVPSIKLAKKEEWVADGLLLATYFVDENGLKQGRYEGRDRTGKLVMYGSYKDNAKIGQWTDYDGTESDSGTYKNGHRIGKWISPSGVQVGIYDRDGYLSTGGFYGTLFNCGEGY